MPAAHRIPVIERMMDLLAQLERAEDRPTVRALAASSGVPRTTVYRILNTLEAHGMVVRAGSDGGYRLGSRLLALAARVPQGSEWQRLADSIRPTLQRLASETGQTAKLSVLDAGEALCVAVVQGTSPFATAPLLGGRYPLHAGAASKVLLAAMDGTDCEQVLHAPLPAFTARTVTDPELLRRQLARIRRQGWAEDAGEHSLSVRAVAAPVRDDARVIGAVSIAYLADRRAADRRLYHEAVRRAVAGITLPPAARVVPPDGGLSARG